jgi:ribonuclease HI
MCRGEGVLYLKENHRISFKAVVGEGTNNRAELYALWLLMRPAFEKGLEQLQILGDSKLVISWENGKNNLQNLSLYPIM